jgi:hypothetical protein
MTSRQVLAPDALLVERCLTGDRDAWRALYRRHHCRLVRCLDRLLWPPLAHTDCPEEALARLWYGLAAGGRDRLPCFATGRGEHGAFLAAVARRQLARLAPAACRPGRALTPAAGGGIAVVPDDVLSEGTVIGEFVGRLTKAERRFYRRRLLAPPSERDMPLTDRQKRLRHRVRVKLLRYLVGR